MSFHWLVLLAAIAVEIVATAALKSAVSTSWLVGTLPLLLIGLAAAIAIPSVIQLATRQTPAPEPALPRSAEAELPVWPSKPTASANPSGTPAQSLASRDKAGCHRSRRRPQ